MTDLDVYEILVLRHKYKLNVAEIATIFEEPMVKVREVTERDWMWTPQGIEKLKATEPWRGIADG